MSRENHTLTVALVAHQIHDDGGMERAGVVEPAGRPAEAAREQLDLAAHGLQGKYSQRIRIFAANESAHWPKLGFNRPQPVTRTKRVNQSLSARGHDLLALANDLPAWTQK